MRESWIRVLIVQSAPTSARTAACSASYNGPKLDWSESAGGNALAVPPAAPVALCGGAGQGSLSISYPRRPGKPTSAAATADQCVAKTFRVVVNNKSPIKKNERGGDKAAQDVKKRKKEKDKETRVRARVARYGH